MALTDGETVAVVDDAAVGPLGANYNDGVLRTGSGLSYTAAGDNAYVTLDTVLNGSGAADKVAFWSDANTLTSDDNLHWDSTNNRLGVGTSESAVYATLHVLKTGSPIAPTSLSVVGIFQNDNSASDNSEVHIASGTSGKAAIYFGDSHHTDEGHISFDNNNSNHYMNISANRVGCNTTSPGARFHVVDDATGLSTGKFSKNASGASVPVVEIHQDHTSGGVACLNLVQDDTDQPYIDFDATGEGVFQTGNKDRNISCDESVRVELNGSDYKIPLFAI